MKRAQNKQSNTVRRSGKQWACSHQCEKILEAGGVWKLTYFCFRMPLGVFGPTFLILKSVSTFDFIQMMILNRIEKGHLMWKGRKMHFDDDGHIKCACMEVS